MSLADLHQEKTLWNLVVIRNDYLNEDYDIG